MKTFEASVRIINCCRYVANCIYGELPIYGHMYYNAREYTRGDTEVKRTIIYAYRAAGYRMVWWHDVGRRSFSHMRKLEFRMSGTPRNEQRIKVCVTRPTRRTTRVYIYAVGQHWVEMADRLARWTREAWPDAKWEIEQTLTTVPE